jgi:hypothetical protein
MTKEEKVQQWIKDWKLKRQVDMRIEPHVIARDADYAGFIDEIKRTGIEITN